MITLSEEARKKYAEFTSAASKDSSLIVLLNIIHDKYKIVQLYPNVGTPVSEDERKIELTAGWSMLYIQEDNGIRVVDFVND